MRMRMRRCVWAGSLALVGVMTAVMTAATAAHGVPSQQPPDTSGSGLTEEGLGIGGVVRTPGQQQEAPARPGAAGPTATAYWVREYAFGDLAEMSELGQLRDDFVRARQEGAVNWMYEGIGSATWCFTGEETSVGGPPAPPPPQSEPGVFVYDTLIDAATGAELADRESCVSIDDLLADPAAGLPPDPPTVEEVWDSMPIEPAQIRISPSTRGLTGLTSWFWADDPGTLEAGATIRGWGISGSAAVDEWRWDVGEASYTSSSAGSEQDPAVEHLYEVKDTYQVSVERTWTGSYTLSGYGVSYTVDGLSTEDSAAIDYQVVEVVSEVDECAEPCS